MQKDLCITKKHCAINIMTVVLFVSFLLVALPVKVNAEANTGIISNETTYKELTDDDQLSGLDVTLDDYIDNMKNDYDPGSFVCCFVLSARPRQEPSKRNSPV